MGESFLRREVCCPLPCLFAVCTRSAASSHANYRAIGASCSLHRRTASCHRQRCARKRFYVPTPALAQRAGGRVAVLGSDSTLAQPRANTKAPHHARVLAVCAVSAYSHLDYLPLLCGVFCAPQHYMSEALLFVGPLAFISGSFVVAQLASLPCLPLLHIYSVPGSFGSKSRFLLCLRGLGR